MEPAAVAIFTVWSSDLTRSAYALGMISSEVGPYTAFSSSSNLWQVRSSTGFCRGASTFDPRNMSARTSIAGARTAAAFHPILQKPQERHQPSGASSNFALSDRRYSCQYASPGSSSLSSARTDQRSRKVASASLHASQSATWSARLIRSSSSRLSSSFATIHFWLVHSQCSSSLGPFLNTPCAVYRVGRAIRVKAVRAESRHRHFFFTNFCLSALTAPYRLPLAVSLAAAENLRYLSVIKPS